MTKVAWGIAIGVVCYTGIVLAWTWDIAHHVPMEIPEDWRR